MLRRTLFLAVAIAACLPAQCYLPVWSDEFGGETIDRNKWSFQTGAGGWGNNELQFYTDRTVNATTRDGMLVITARREDHQGARYTSARMRSIRKGDWRYGRFEARMRLPAAQGLWPAFWMMPTDSVYGNWPFSGEIDIMELVGKLPARTFSTIHTANEAGGHVSFGGHTDLSGGVFHDDFHVFSAEWEPELMRFFLDGEPFYTREKPLPDGGTWPFHHRFHIILNLAVGGNWPGPPDGTTTFPQEFEIDYVRVLQKPEDIQITGPQLVEPQAQAEYAVPRIDDVTYEWLLPENATIVSGEGTHAITVQWGDHGGDVGVKLTSSCGEGTPILPVQVTRNLWTNPGFESGMSGWTTRAARAGLAEFSIDQDDAQEGEKSALVKVLSPGANAWDVQLSRPEVPITRDETYTLSFWAKASEAGSHATAACIDASTYASFGSSTFQLTTGWQRYELTFAAPSSTVAMCNLDLARDIGTYRFDSFDFQRATPSQ